MFLEDKQYNKTKYFNVHSPLSLEEIVTKPH